MALQFQIESREQLDQWQTVLTDRYVNHEIDATLYASLSEDIALMKRRIGS